MKRKEKKCYSDMRSEAYMSIADITILTILAVLLRKAILLIKELFEVKADHIVAQYGTGTFDV